MKPAPVAMTTILSVQFDAPCRDVGAEAGQSGRAGRLDEDSVVEREPALHGPDLPIGDFDQMAAGLRESVDDIAAVEQCRYLKARDPGARPTRQHTAPAAEHVAHRRAPRGLNSDDPRQLKPRPQLTVAAPDRRQKPASPDRDVDGGRLRRLFRQFVRNRVRPLHRFGTEASSRDERIEITSLRESNHLVHRRRGHEGIIPKPDEWDHARTVRGDLQELRRGNPGDDEEGQR